MVIGFSFFFLRGRSLGHSIPTDFFG